jgi:hypothetical protein
MLAEATRLSMLQAMGIEVYRLRAVAAPVHLRAHDAKIVVVGAADAVPARLRMQLPGALGVAAERVHWYDVGASVPDDAAGYVVIGTEAARALGVQLSTMQQNTAIIAATAEPAALLPDGAAKRALWQVLKPVARRLRERS